MIRVKTLLSIVSLGLILSSCGVQSCDEPLVVDTGVVFMRGGANYTFPMISFGGIQKHPTLDKDTVLKRDTIRNAKSLELPLKITSDISSFEICFYPSENMPPLTDTLTINHQNTNYFISEDCGCLVFHTIESIQYTRSRIDSAYIYNPNVTNEKFQNIILQFN
ncbi:MAG: DUF6452 family protein [Bacteroidales bacterium]